MRKIKLTTRPWKQRPVDPLFYTEDLMCLLLLARGRSNRAITQATGLTQSQISYRARMFGVSRMDYRNGTGPYARQLDQATKPLLEEALKKHLKQHFRYQQTNANQPSAPS